MTNTIPSQIPYDTEDTELVQHKIDAKTLNTSIGSMTDLISTVDKWLNDGQQTMKLMVTNPVEAGSLSVSHTMMELVPHTINVAKVIGLTGLAGAAIGAPVLPSIRQLGSEKVISITKRAGTDQSVLELEDEEIVCHDSVTKLVTGLEIRNALVNVVRVPLDGKEGAVFRVPDEDNVEVVRPEGEETEEIKPFPRDTLLEKEESMEEVNVRFVQINLEKTKGWRIKYLGEEHAVLFEDQLFIRQVQDGIVSSAKENLLIIDLKTTKTFAARNASTKYAMTRVKRKRPTEA